ncbi:MAG: RHS repeat-associated core domain-containing protein [Ardenticatenaceae bacterium]|nr:RHS repeat-associated core domain-containing protein [Ardenticatenaceae bacterium]
MSSLEEGSAPSGGQVAIQRSTYFLAGQAVAVRVTGDLDIANDGLFYLYSDHLGSASAIQRDGGVSDPIVTRYLPFGGYRTGIGPNEVTDRGFTGQRENMSLGLYYYQARYYLPSIGRFASADTLVPQQARQELTVDFHETNLLLAINDDNQKLFSLGPIYTWNDKQKQENGVPNGPTNPQLLNRYSYALDNPLKFTDPSGHFSIQIELTAEQAQVLIDYLLGSNGDIGTSEIVYDIGQGMNLLAGTAFASTPFSGLLGGGLAGGAFLLGENAKETSNTLTQIANILQSEIDAGATTLSIGVEDLWWGDKITGSGLNAHAISAPLMLDSAGRVLKAWMFYVDNDAPVLIEFWEGGGEFYWRKDDGSIAYK